MEIELIGIDYRANIYDVKEEFARILHSERFKRIKGTESEETRPINFRLILGKSDKGYHDGSGTLTLPHRRIGEQLLNLARQNKIFPVVNSRRIRMRDDGEKVPRWLVETLRKLPYQDPSIDRERDDIRFKLGISWRIDKLQFGRWHPRPAPRHDEEHRGLFAVEWEKDYTKSGNAQVGFDYDQKLVRLRLGDPFLQDDLYYVIIRFSNVQQLWVGYEIKAYICFDLLTPPIFESQWINQTQTGISFIDTQKSRQRVLAIDENHRRVAPYAYQVRVILHAHNDLEEFVQSCDVAGLRLPRMSNIVSECHDFFSQRMLCKVQKSFREFQDLPWTISFQIECFLYNGLLTTVQLLEGLLPVLSELVKSHPDVAGTLLRDFGQTVTSGVHIGTQPGDVAQYFKQFCSNRLRFTTSLCPGTVIGHNDEHEGQMDCHHVTFTPTRMLLEGPYAIQSNRVLRLYNKFHDHFLRVDFRDEDRLQFRWDHQVDGTTLLDRRVGAILKEGFDLGGRHFEFLGYSSSALREHCVWFVSPFHHSERGPVNASSIREEVGDLSAELAFPAKFAARLALAFSGTNPSVKIQSSQWSIIPDIGREPYLLTDGVGTISRELGRLIWSEECRMNPSLNKYVEPSAYQIRFLGFKGVVAIDDHLKGIQMCLRPSMRKFESHNVDAADIEIANAFCTPSPLYLNQPLVMILEDRGVKKETFMELLESAVANTHFAQESVDHFAAVMRTHGLGAQFGLSSLLHKLSVRGFDLNSRNRGRNLRTPFIDKLISTTISTALRDIQYRCRIPVLKSHTLVGVADEGPAYIQRKEYAEDEVFALDEGDVFVCVQADLDSEPTVWAIGRPPEDKFCAFRNLKNVVVFSSKGKRSLASCLSGGDLDGDIFNICQYQPLFGSIYDQPANFPPSKPWKLDDLSVSALQEVDGKTGQTRIDPEKIIPYVCDFVVKYIDSDVLGVLADQHLIRADQSPDGVRDWGCLKLAELCSRAVDYPKNGLEVDVSNLPPRLIPSKPDWKRNETDEENRTHYYRSERAIGEIFRRVEMIASGKEPKSHGESTYLQVSEHPIHMALKSSVDAKLQGALVELTSEDKVRSLFRDYYYELEYICRTHSLTDHSRLREEEVVIGAILARCSRHRWRTDRMYRMRVHASDLVKKTREAFVHKQLKSMTSMEATQALEFAWTSWQIVTDKLTTEDAKRNPFGLNSFGIIALNVVLECLEYLNN